MDSIKTYCRHNKAAFLVLLCADPSRKGTPGGRGTIDKALSQESVILENTALNDNLFISTIKMSAKQIEPVTGLKRIGRKRGTFIFASPKQRLQSVAKGRKLPHFAMTTGACTGPEYITEHFMSERTSYIANEDHVMGAIVVEVKDNQKYSFTQVQADSTGAFIDRGKHYSKKGVKKYSPTAIIPGDWHTGHTCPKARQSVIKLIKTLKPKYLIFHDLFDGTSVNHHEARMKLKRAIAAKHGKLSIKEELKLVKNELEYFSKLVEQIHIVRSNHDEFLDRYMEDFRWVDEPQNHEICFKIGAAMLEKKFALQAGLEAVGLDAKNINFLTRNDSLPIGGIETSQHGDKGKNGSRGSIRGMEDAYDQIIFGHNHGVEILRGAMCVGTSTELDLDYNKGASTWINAAALVYKNGSRQLILTNTEA